MGRLPKPYTRELTAIREMNPGTTIKFKLKNPYGLTNKIYAMFREWMIGDYYDVKTNKKSGEVVVTMEGGVVFIYDDDHSEEEY